MEIIKRCFSPPLFLFIGRKEKASRGKRRQNVLPWCRVWEHDERQAMRCVINILTSLNTDYLFASCQESINIWQRKKASLEVRQVVLCGPWYSLIVTLGKILNLFQAWFFNLITEDTNRTYPTGGWWLLTRTSMNH